MIRVKIKACHLMIRVKIKACHLIILQQKKTQMLQRTFQQKKT